MQRATNDISPELQALLTALHGRRTYGVAAFDAELRLVHANAPWARFLALATGREAEPLPDALLTDLLPEAEDIQAAARQALATGEPVELPGRTIATDDGEQYWDLSIPPIIDAGQATGLLCVATDVTGRVAAERAATAKIRLAAFRADVSQALASSDEVDAVLQACAEAMVRHAPAAFARIWVLDEIEDAYRLRASAGLYTGLNGTYSRVPAEWIRQKTFSGFSPSMETDILKTHHVREPDWAAEQGLVAWASHPLTVRGQIVGFMAMFARQNFDPDTLSELAAVADAIAQFLERKHAEATVRERELHFRTVFESAVDGLMLFDLETGQIFEANPAICRMHGYDGEEFARLRRLDLAHPEARDHVRAVHERLRDQGQARAQIRHLRRDGTAFYVEIHGSLIPYAGRSAVLAVVRDVTQEQAAQEQLEQRVTERTRDLSLLLDISRGVASTLDLKPLLELILDHLKTVVDYTGTAILTRSGDHLTIAGHRGPLPLEVAHRILRYPIAGLAPVWDRFSRGEAIMIPDVRGTSVEARVFRDLVGADLDAHLGFVGSCLWVPLVVKDRLIGLMSIARRETDAFTPDRIELAAAIARQAAVAIENARLFEQAQGKAALEERQRLARELHDSVSQALYGIGLGARTARALLDRDPAKVAEPLDYVMSLAAAGMEEMRALIFELRPESLEQEGLLVALQKLGDAMRARREAEVEVSLATQEPAIPLAMKEALYRIAQEALHNTNKHARATRVALRLDRVDDVLTLAIEDNGIGFDSSRSFPGHLGLVSMQERTAPFGGRVSIDSVPGAGTSVRVTMPLPDLP